MVRLLSEKAGFTADEAQIIAYASQFVDGANANQPFKIKDVPDFGYERYKNGYFDPVCTAHKDIENVKGLDPIVQKKVYISYHFIPKEKFEGAKTSDSANDLNYEYKTSPNNSFSREILNIALDELRGNKKNRQQKLIKLGIALHSYADTWSHQGFSGKKSRKDNDIEGVGLYKGNDIEEVSDSLLGIFGELAPIGHIQASVYPDRSNLTWRYEQDYDGVEVHRENTKIYLKAALTIYETLCKFNDVGPSWKQIVDKINECLSVPTNSKKKKFKKYVEVFPEVKFDYDHDEWRKAAMKKGYFNFGDYYAKDYKKLVCKFNNDMKWYYFHLEALNQRKFVMDNIPA
jgi:hypothetical protein